MMSLREYRSKAANLPDFLPWAALVSEGVVLNKDGSFQRTARFRGPDLDSAPRDFLYEGEMNVDTALFPEVRERVRSICQSIPTRSISGVRLDIDANRQP